MQVKEEYVSAGVFLVVGYKDGWQNATSVFYWIAHIKRT